MRLLGDGINVVSPLQEQAPIGGVLVSAAVMDLIAGRIEEPIEELGPLKLRNMSRPVHAYAVGPGRRSTAATGHGVLGEDRPRARFPALPAYAAVALSRSSAQPSTVNCYEQLLPKPSGTNRLCQCVDSATSRSIHITDARRRLSVHDDAIIAVQRGDAVDFIPLAGLHRTRGGRCPTKLQPKPVLRSAGSPSR
jgi:hypothetical protein